MTAEARVTVLICDDDAMIRGALHEVLRAEPDFTVVAIARDPDEAIVQAEKHLPDVAVLDVRMPAGGGARAAAEIRRLSPATRILAFSAYTNTATTERMTRAGVAEYLRKGVPNDEIVAAVRRLGRPG